MGTFVTPNTFDSLVSISSFSKGGANKIFDEVNKSGCKIVLKNNTPACVLISPDSYCALMAELEELRLLKLVEERIANDNGVTISADEVYLSLGIADDESDDIPMEYGVDFE